MGTCVKLLLLPHVCSNLVHQFTSDMLNLLSGLQIALTPQPNKSKYYISGTHELNFDRHINLYLNKRE